jgi:hypothetical protein
MPTCVLTCVHPCVELCVAVDVLAKPRTARVIGGLDSSDIFCNSDYKHFLA